MSTSNNILELMTIIPAGAGSGKTFTVQQRLGEWVEKGLIEPQRIVAVTFTEAAASELRERIRARLLEIGRLDDALKLDQAYISTIHGFGLKILTEFSFEAGSSPQPRLLNEDEQSALIRQSLSHTSKVQEIIHDLSAYGYKYEFSSGKSAEECFRGDVLNVISLLRSMGWQEGDADASHHAVEWIKTKYGGTLNGDILTKELHQFVMALLNEFPHSLSDEHGNSDASTKDLSKNFRNLKSAADISVLKKDWALWQGLRKLRISNSRCKLPEEYDALALQVIDAANQLPSHPGPLQHAVRHLDALLAAGQEVLIHYSEAKREAGLVDYSDMIAMAHDLLDTNDDVLNTLKNRIDCLVVDEFQDTNPLQFSLLWKLKEAGIPTLIVGDLKQAIMGFQGADARLFSALDKQFSESTQPLTQNWRSQPELMGFVNAIGPVLFGDAYTALTPKAADSELSPLEIVDFPKSSRKGQHIIRAGHVGKRIKALLEGEDQYIIDRRTNKRRILQGGDIAILAPTKNMLMQYADVLRALGLKVRLKEDGWRQSREIQVALQALAYVANPEDRHAALYLSVTELGQLSLNDALSQLMTLNKIQDPILNGLDTLSESVTERTIYALVVDTLHHLGIYDVVSTWEDAEQARANLLRLQAESAEYMDANREALSNGGIYGSGIQSFLAWLKEKSDDNDMQPAPRVIDEDAIELVTWHSSKGREWPVVTVAGMDKTIKARVPNFGLGYESFDDLAALLSSTQIEYSPKFSASETNDNYLEALEENVHQESRRLLYVALTRARDKLIVEWPSYREGKGGCYWSILAYEDDVSLGEDYLNIAGENFFCTVNAGSDVLPAEIDLDEEPATLTLPTVGRRAITPSEVPTDLIPDSISPSILKDVGDEMEPVTDLDVMNYAAPLILESSMPANELGTAVHREFEVLGSRPDLPMETLRKVISPLEEDIVVVVKSQVRKFESWIANHFSPTEIHRELPFISVNNVGTVVSGTVDMVLVTEQGIIILDHKTDRVDDPKQAFNNYLPQLQAYADALSKQMGEVVSVGIHWIRSGDVVLLQH